MQRRNTSQSHPQNSLNSRLPVVTHLVQEPELELVPHEEKAVVGLVEEITVGSHAFDFSEVEGPGYLTEGSLQPGRMCRLRKGGPR